MIRTLLIDNYDSFTFNLFQLLAEVNGCEPTVIKNDELTWDRIDSGSYDNIVLSPGPGSPDHPKRFGICADAIRHAKVPLLGVCLGHQGIAHHLGGKIAHAPTPMHGRRSDILHNGSGVFHGLPNPLSATRYHSLIVTELPPNFVQTAWTRDGLNMALAHRDQAIFGVQFHPESICTQAGKQLLENFANITRRHRPRRPTVVSSWSPRPIPTPQKLSLHTRKLDFFPNPESAFITLYANRTSTFWLDSASEGRFSYMGEGPTIGGNQDLLDPLNHDLHNHRTQADTPFDFLGGYVGYFGYELLSGEGDSATPGSILIRPQHYIVFDHLEKHLWLVSTADDAASWMDQTEAALRSLPSSIPAPQCQEQHVDLTLRHPPEEYLKQIERCRHYLIDGESYELCLTNQLTAGAKVDPLSYYRNLRRLNPAPYAAYFNFGDFAIACSSPELFLHVDRQQRVESKPIKGTARRSADPAEDELLKSHLARDEKTQAENLMIVDLLRNDLGKVCEIGSVHVPSLMQIETYATVHQMVSTVAGKLTPDCSIVDCIRAAFPGGSMTGAPKIRSMQLLRELEQGPRGIYSGAIGYLSYSGTAKLNIVIRTAIIHKDQITLGSGGAIVAMSDPQKELEEMLLKLEPTLQALAQTVGRPLKLPALAAVRLPPDRPA
ncbi:MAG TPA: aminodeoxychorismate synthase component I [Tepidisphaeraceae bacterium]